MQIDLNVEERLKKMEREAAGLWLAIRIALAALVGGATLRALYIHMMVPKWKEIFMDLLEGQPLPALTAWYIAYGRPVVLSLALAGFAAMLMLFIAPRHRWVPRFAVAVVLIGLVVTELADFAVRLPLITIIQKIQS
jgi:hypothetical protein